MREVVRSQRTVVDFADLLDGAANEEPWALDALADEYLPRLTAFARTRGAVDPGGIADVALMSVFPRLAELQFEAGEQLWAYLCLTARSRIIDEHRRTRPVVLTGDPESIDGVTPAFDPFDDQIVDRDYVSGLLAELTDEQRQVLELRFLEDLSIEETASLTGRSQGAVKGLQRRAINAIIAAVAVVLAVLAVRGLTDRVADTDANIGPADQTEETDEPEQTETTDPDGAGRTESGPVVVDADQSEQGAPVVADGGTSNGGISDEETSDEQALDEQASDAQGTGEGVATNDEPGATGGVGEGAVVRVTAGTAAASAMNTSGAPGDASRHGVRIRCVTSHFSHDDPISAPGLPGAASAQVYWGNTTAGSSTDGPSLPDAGNGTCDGGVTDRSAYWMPALFTEEDRAAVPSTILVEYKSFGGPDFDRRTLQPLPIGLELVAAPAVANRFTTVGNVGPDGDGLQLSVSFPSCVQVDAAGRAVLSSADGLSHLSYRSPEDGRSDECPESHPYRIPQLSYRLTYDVAWESDWYLAGEVGVTQGSATVTGSAIVGWGSSANRDVVTCVRDLLTNCWFAELTVPAPAPESSLADATFSPRPTG